MKNKPLIDKKEVVGFHTEVIFKDKDGNKKIVDATKGEEGLKVKDVKEAIKKAEDFIISMKRDDDKVWNMRLNLIIEEFRTKIFGEFK